MPEASTLQIPNDVLQPIINAHVSAAVATALGGQAQLIEAAVAMALNIKVDDQGNASHYAHSTSPTFLKWLVDDAIRKAATDAVREYLTRDMEAIKAMGAKEMKNQKSPLTRSLIESIAKGAAESGRWNIRVTVGENPK